MRALLLRYRTDCRLGNIYWGLTEEEFSNLTDKNCHYCGIAPYRSHYNYVYNGVDRKDKDQGYTLSNCVTACWPCNKLKGKELSYEEMLAVAKLLKEMRPAPPPKPSIAKQSRKSTSSPE